ncbi:MAG TPA: hypothetical protein VLH79_01360 [Chthonomonadales bacterium]|nr:hypothetical protein [Chthonomonadales bacterium]
MSQRDPRYLPELHTPWRRWSSVIAALAVPAIGAYALTQAIPVAPADCRHTPVAGSHDGYPVSRDLRGGGALALLSVGWLVVVWRVSRGASEWEGIHDARDLD